ncbi:YtcA family lipoprotein [Kluyvera genomosp. 1]|uniref:YtcA family lipoprotein n=1 Tax=Kluyvera genomosp. 1 TaxID=2774053 RepID=UPI00068F3EDA|nr:YtcA family lipoprotein [Kluyvera genomosp. 1]
MQIVKSRMVMPLKKYGWLTLATLLSGCSLPPAIPVIGAYYPGWLFCIIAGVILVLITRRLMLHKYNVISFAGVIYTALFALYSMLFWLVFF